jgi:hypothetical protein
VKALREFARHDLQPMSDLGSTEIACCIDSDLVVGYSCQNLHT